MDGGGLVVIAEDDESRLKSFSLLTGSRLCCAQHSSAPAVWRVSEGGV